MRLSPSVSACTSKHFQRAPRQLVDDLLIGAVVTLAVDQGVVHPRRARSSCADPRQCKPRLHRILAASGHLAACHHGPGPESAEYDKHRRRRTPGTRRVRLRGRPNKSLNRGERQLAIAATPHPHAELRALRSCILMRGPAWLPVSTGLWPCRSGISVVHQLVRQICQLCTALAVVSGYGRLFAYKPVSCTTEWRLRRFGENSMIGTGSDGPALSSYHLNQAKRVRYGKGYPAADRYTRIQ